ncbi:MAG TPA: NAD(P)-binding domain-containing protein [Candidatus Paceibacterota bacterium]|nr:NAD(P)-binding domain-containing protein [Candidatus Paceibacterota bacterium]
MKIGFIGQGWIGKNYADDFENRGYTVIRYAKEAPYDKNKDAIKDCDIVFIAVPTPTTPKGSDTIVVENVLKLVGKGKIAVIKSTVLPGTTEILQKENPDIFILNSPEFLSTGTAAHDASHPKRNIIGVPVESTLYRAKAKEVMRILAKAPYEKICGSKDAEIIKYARNIIGYVRVVFANMLYDVAKEMGADWIAIREAISADPDNGPTYMNPIHKSGRGAGGECFIKDFVAFSTLYKEIIDDSLGQKMLQAIEKKNTELLSSTNKDIELLRGVYGNRI